MKDAKKTFVVCNIQFSLFFFCSPPILFLFTKSCLRAQFVLFSDFLDLTSKIQFRVVNDVQFCQSLRILLHCLRNLVHKNLLHFIFWNNVMHIAKLELFGSRFSCFATHIAYFFCIITAILYVSTVEFNILLVLLLIF